VVELRAAPAFEADDRRVVAVGTAVWLVLLALCLVFLGRLRAVGHLWWVAACATGAGLGLLGLLVLRRRDAGRQRRLSPPSTTQTSPVV